MFPTKESLHAVKRQAVLREAAASFTTKGYHATSLSEVAASLGVTKAALYHYFPNKNALLMACFARAMEVCFESLARGRREGANGREKLLLTLTLYLSNIIDELSCCVVLMEEQALEPEDRAKLVADRDRFEAALRDLVREGIRDGSIVRCDPKFVIFIILGGLNWVPKWFKPEGRWKSEQISAALGQLFERALSTEPAAGLAPDVGRMPLASRRGRASAPRRSATLDALEQEAPRRTRAQAQQERTR